MLRKIFLADKEVFKRIRANDRTVLGELFIVNEKPISSYIQKNGGSLEDAQDYLQEAIIILWQKVNSETLELSAKISTYLFAIARNKWMAESRRRKKHDYNSTQLEKISTNNDSLLDLIGEEEKNAVHDALQKLGSPCRELLLMYYFEERKMAEIARLLHFANSDVVKSKKYQCKKALEELLEKYINK